MSGGKRLYSLDTRMFHRWGNDLHFNIGSPGPNNKEHVGLQQDRIEPASAR